MYFEGNYGFQRYFLHDLDGNGVPELFLYSTSMDGMTACYTYDGNAKIAGYFPYYGINEGLHELIGHGHWHGAAGIYDYEWHNYTLSGSTLNMGFYTNAEQTDSGDLRYLVYDSDYNVISDTKAAFDEFVQVHAAPSRSLESYTMYNLGDVSGLSNIQ